MSRVSYQVDVGRPHVTPPGFTALDPGAIQTRARDAKVRFAVELSKPQARWLRQVAGSGGADDSAVVRALIDLGMELDIDWRSVGTASDVRRAVREAVLLRRDR